MREGGLSGWTISTGGRSSWDLLDGYLLVGEGDKNDWGRVQSSREGGMGPALDGLTIDGVGSSERGADDDGWEGPGVYVCMCVCV